MARVRNDSRVQRAIFLPATGTGDARTPSSPIVLQPHGGEATIPDDVWAKIKDRPVIKAWIEDEILAVGGKAKKRKPPPVEPDADNRTAAHRTGADMRKAAEAAEEEAEESDGNGTEPQISDFAKAKVAEALLAAGMTVETIALSTIEELTAVDGVGEPTAVKLIEAATAALA